MKLITFEINNENRLGTLIHGDGGDFVIDLNQSDPSLPTNMIDFLKAGTTARQRAENVLGRATPAEQMELAAVKLKAPIPRPGKIIGIGLNYFDHAAESNQAVPQTPAVFSKYANTVIGPGEQILIPKVTNLVDYEAELAFVIGKQARHVKETVAFSYIAGYLPLNDVSARDYQNRTSQWTIGKTFDTFAPMGPAIVTTDEIPDPHNLNIRLLIGDEVLQDSNTSNLIFDVPYLVAYLSEVMTLEPGDVVTTGTPAGVGFARTPPRFLQSGDIVKVEIEGLGTLENPVGTES